MSAIRVTPKRTVSPDRGRMQGGYADFMSIVAKILSLGMGEHSHTLCVMTNYRIIYRSVASNCRGERRCWEASIPISAIRSVFW